METDIILWNSGYRFRCRSLVFLETNPAGFGIPMEETAGGTV